MKKIKSRKNLKKKKTFKQNNKVDFCKKLNSLQESINSFSKNIPLYTFISNKEYINISSIADINTQKTNMYDYNVYSYINDDKKDNKEPKIYKCTKVLLQPSKTQTKLLLDMLEGYRLVYNLTLSFIKTRHFLNKKQIKEIEEETKKQEQEELKKNDNNCKPKKVKLSKEEKEKMIIEKLKLKDEKIRFKKKKEELIKSMTEEEKIEENRKLRILKIDKVKNENNFDPIYDYKIIRTYFLKDKISKIASIYKTPIHTLDKAVCLACTSYKSAISNFNNKNINNFRIRFIKKNKSSLMMDIEKIAFTNDGKSFIKSILGNTLLNKNNYNYSNINNDCKIHYNKKNKKFILLVPQEINKIKNENKNYISIDPGLRTFLNCVTNDSYIEIGTNLRDKIKEELKMLDKRKMIKTSKRRKRYVNIISERIKNQIKDTHWKIIDYLTKTYKTIIIGKWSTKSIMSNEDSILNKMNKRIVQTLSFYQFLEKLKYKSLIRNVELKIVEEHYTSKVCTNCGHYKKELKGDKIYNCKECNIKIMRDYNGARNIFIKSINTMKT